jgi:hypothetical protein
MSTNICNKAVTHLLFEWQRADAETKADAEAQTAAKVHEEELLWWLLQRRVGTPTEAMLLWTPCRPVDAA